jgi:flagellar biosynthesis protein FlhB
MIAYQHFLQLLIVHVQIISDCLLMNGFVFELLAAFDFLLQKMDHANVIEIYR